MNREYIKINMDEVYENPDVFEALTRICTNISHNKLDIKLPCLISETDIKTPKGLEGAPIIFTRDINNQVIALINPTIFWKNRKKICEICEYL